MDALIGLCRCVDKVLSVTLGAGQDALREVSSTSAGGSMTHQIIDCGSHLTLILGRPGTDVASTVIVRARWVWKSYVPLSSCSIRKPGPGHPLPTTCVGPPLPPADAGWLLSEAGRQRGAEREHGLSG